MNPSHEISAQGQYTTLSESWPHEATVAGVTEIATERLVEAGCPKPQEDAEALVALAVGRRASQPLAPDVPISVSERHLLAEFIERRAAREPLGYILGSCRFRGLEFSVDHRVIVPHERSGVLVDIAVQLPARSRVHDLGTGSGAIALVTKWERPDLRVSGSDIARGAIVVARANGTRLGIDVLFEVCRGMPSGDYDLVVANLPYQGEDEATARKPEADYQPHIGVYGGSDGLDVIRTFLAEAPAGLTVALQHAPCQAASVQRLLRDSRTVSDVQGVARATIGVVPS